MLGNVAAIVGDPVDDAVAERSEFLRSHSGVLSRCLW
jgi:hypothetical protein